MKGATDFAKQTEIWSTPAGQRCRRDVILTLCRRNAPARPSGASFQKLTVRAKKIRGLANPKWASGTGSCSQIHATQWRQTALIVICCVEYPSVQVFRHFTFFTSRSIARLRGHEKRLRAAARVRIMPYVAKDRTLSYVSAHHSLCIATSAGTGRMARSCPSVCRKSSARLVRRI